MVEMLRLDQAAFYYPQGRWGLETTSLAVTAGEGVLVTGPSGCGKSTFSRCLTGLIPHLYRGELRGDVWLGDHKTDETPLWQLAEQAGLVFQNPAGQMLAESVENEIIFGLENLGLTGPEVEARLEASLTRFGLQELRHRSPQTLSGGEQQKLALAAIIARRPPVLVLDEPLSMLDSKAASELVDHLDHLVRSGTTVIVCEHRQEYLHESSAFRDVALGNGAHVNRSKVDTGFRAVSRPSYQLEIKDLQVERGGQSVIRDLNVSAQSGKVVTLVGRNGVGKTTLLRAMAGIQKYQGSIFARRNGDQVKPDFGMVFQNPDLQLFNASVREEILYRVPDPDMVYYEWLLEVLGLADYEATPPLLLSEGEKRRVALATVLIRQPEHGILLDEPALGQDAAHKEVLLGVVHALAQAGQLVVLATHDLELASSADQLVLLGSDGIVAAGPPADLMGDDDLWERLGLLLPRWVRLKCCP
jgi:energy-coupling factor transport system ATP-binding protein